MTEDGVSDQAPSGAKGAPRSEREDEPAAGGQGRASS